MKFSTRMVLIPETEYLLLKASTGTKRKQTFTEMTQDMSKKIRLSERDKAELFQPSVNIIEHLPPIYHSKAKRLLAELAIAKIKHTDSKEVVLPNGAAITRSNIVDLITEALVPNNSRLKPIGWDDFLESIAASNIPSTMFKKTVKNAIGLMRAGPAWEAY